MIFGLLYFCVVICVNRSRSSFILYRIVKRHSRQSNVRRIWTCADNGIKPGSDSIMINKHTTKHSKTASLGIYWPVCDVYIAHTTIKPEVSISLTEMPFLILQVNFHTSNDFCDWRLLKGQR